MSVILASKSPYKQNQLRILGIPFQTCSPDVDENHSAFLTPEALAMQLATEKAKAVQPLYPESIIIGSDQTAELDSGQLLTKPGDRPTAITQLKQSSGRTARFHSAICLAQHQQVKVWSVETRVRFRELTDAEIGRYIDADDPLDCAGSFKVESLGIALFETVQSDDPTALVGLGLISLAAQLRKLGLAIP